MISAKRIWRDVAKERGSLTSILLFLLGASAFEVFAPRLLGEIVDSITQGVLTGEDVREIISSMSTTLFILILLYGGHALFTYISEHMMAGVAERIVLDLRMRVAHHIFSTPMGILQGKNRGDLLSRITSDLDNVAETVRESVPGLISAVIGIIGALTMMILISPYMASVIIAIIIIGMAILYGASTYARRVYLKNQEALGAFNGGIEEVISGKVVVQSFGLERVMTDHLDDLSKNLFHSMKKAGFMGQIILPLVNFINQIGYVFVALQGVYSILQGVISVGSVQAFFLYVTQISDPISRISYILTKLQETWAALGRIYEILDMPIEENEGTSTFKSVPQGKIEFSHVSFGYRGDTLLLNDLNIHINPGEMVAIVGPTGSGKTTIANLLMRFYEVQQGTISIDTIPIMELSRETLHQTIGMVLQDAWIFTGTIAENIGYSNPKATREEIVRVAKLAKADYFIRTLPNGYDTILKNGSNDLSQGQLQLIAIARAFLGNPSILILDEATSNVDSRTEQEIQKAMQALLKGRTSIVIAHRLSTIRKADKILVVKDGSIIEEGRHEELMARKGYYHSLYESYKQGVIV